jgi:hypothetical protein
MIARGFGEDSAILTRGFSREVLTETAAAAAAAVGRVVRRARNRSRDIADSIYDRFSVSAALLSVNGTGSLNPILTNTEKVIQETKEVTVKVIEFADVKVTKPSIKIIIDAYHVLKD